MKECGVSDVPSFHAVRKMQKDLQDMVDLKAELHTSSLSNHFYMNRPAKLLALDWSNPQVRPLMQLYPEVEVPITEFWQASKWVDESNIDDEAPMWADWDNPAKVHRHYFVQELAITEEDDFVLIMKWLSVKGQMAASVRRVVMDERTGVFVISSEDTRRIPASSLRYNIIDIRRNYDVLFLNESDRVRYPQPNPLRAVGEGKPMFRIRAMVWSDDASGNQSKQYNQHTNTCIINLNIPHRVTSQEYFVRFCSTSQYASSSEQFAALVTDFNVRSWHVAYDCKLGVEIVFQIILHVLPGDNPQQSETASHIGVKGNHNSRRDKVGGTEVEKEKEETYLKLHVVNSDESRRVNDTIAIIKAQLRAACRGDNKLLSEITTREGVKDKLAHHWTTQLLDKAKILKEEMKKAHPRSGKEVLAANIETELWNWLLQQPEACGRTDIQAGIHYNPLLDIRDYTNMLVNLCLSGIDVHKDTPVEILHTYLLGNDKYVWHQTWSNWLSKDCEGVFTNRLQSADLDGLTSMPPRAQYMIRFKNNLIGKHFRCLQELAIFQLHGLVSPEIFDLWRTTGELGALLFFPEIQNMDEYLADLQILIDNLLDAWGQVDPRRIIAKIKLRLMPYLVQDIRRFGPAILYSTEIFESYNYIFRLSSIHSNHHAPSLDIASDIAGAERLKHLISGGWWLNARKEWVQAELATQQWLLHAKVISQSKDMCKEGSWVFFNNRNGKNSVGRITRILMSVNSERSWIILRAFDVCENRDARLNMPVLIPSMDGVILIKPSALVFSFNAQHDCYTAQCSLSSTTGQFFKQERINTSIQKTTVLHTQLDRFLINMHALHNAHLLRQALPRSLTQPIPLHRDIGEEIRKGLSVGLQVSGRVKRDATKAKVAQTRQRKKDMQTSQSAPGGVADAAPA
ncbi:hypothetical protein AGABI2DRAFT_152282 [Agaricus bisporus var. bisporus H97]|uniref:hypothetical protein n=1 Tax=Agaricus bisporus var. bisporus (strain H97 / ATCC MYA-4626 / FGSC 10389) TaxID=936046 RepID=UPI00029F5F5E|nr:hypothetical protein AGABI2DRAFT_152282 [Agaricus bisporus var. bisporus H97]EKV46084.1 hypothetical protein AGABI2DRAFT_152282 [Agaricus bisporus var. bisporus H97]